VPDLAVSAPRARSGGDQRGSVFVLLMHANGTVKDEQEISGEQGGFSGTNSDQNRFGASVSAPVGDVNGDGEWLLPTSLWFLQLFELIPLFS
jgi:hypothetical protein